jgi:hypothetical protein
VITLYVETNFCVSFATGRELEVINLLDVDLPHPGSRFRLAIPSPCFFEARAWMEGEIKRRKEFERLLSGQITRLERDLTSNHARALQSHIEQARIESNRLLLQTNDRLFHITGELANIAELIELNSEILNRSRLEIVIEELTDNLILHCILDHARRNTSSDKAFLSGNHKDFDSQPAREALAAVGVRYFRRAADCLGWVRSVVPS